MPIVACRGATPITDEVELKAYLASVLRLENVGVLLGAGASCSAGGQTMQGLWGSFLRDEPAAADWLLANGFITAAQRGQPIPFRPVVMVPGQAPPPPRPQHAGRIETPNIEHLADTLEITILEWVRSRNRQLRRAKQARAALFRSVMNASVLKPEWWGTHSGVDVADELATHRTVLQKLTSARQPGQAAPWVFTTNYDLAVEWAAESVDMQVINGFLGTHNRRFSPQSFDLGFRNVQARGEARFGVYNIYLAKLHGSLTWKQQDDNFYELPATQAWTEISAFIGGASDEHNYLVLPRAAKYLQTVGYILGELLRRFAEFMARPQTTLIIAGYGFGDEHINRLIRSALLNPTLQLVIYLPEFTGLDHADELAPAVKQLLELRNPRVTIVGGGEGAYFSKLAEQLPDPTIYDESLADLRRKLEPPRGGLDDAGHHG